MWLIGLVKISPGFSGLYNESNPSVKVNSLKTASALGVMVLSNNVSTASGIIGVVETVGVLDTAGVRVMVGESVIVGVSEMVGERVGVGVSVEVTVGG